MALAASNKESRKSRSLRIKRKAPTFKLNIVGRPSKFSKIVKPVTVPIVPPKVTDRIDDDRWQCTECGGSGLQDDADDHFIDSLDDVNDSESDYQQFTEDKSYYGRQQRLMKAWNDTYSCIAKTQVENFSPSCLRQQECFVCGLESAIVQCNTCGGAGMYCIPCAKKLHSSVNFCHSLKIWKVRQQCTIKLNSICLHSCRNRNTDM